MSKAFPSGSNSPGINVENKPRMVESRSSHFSGPMSCNNPSEKSFLKKESIFGSGLTSKNSLRLSLRENFLLGIKPISPALQGEGTIFRNQNFGNFDDIFSKGPTLEQGDLPPISDMSPSMYPGSPVIGTFNSPPKKGTFIQYKGYNYQSNRKSIPQMNIKERLMKPLQKD